MAIILDGKSLSKQIEINLKGRVEVLKQRLNFTPKLATILVGEDPSSKTYVNMKIKACARVGLDSIFIKMPEETTTKELLNKINELNNLPEVAGILLQHPTPKHIDEKLCFNKIAEIKDVDGVNTNNFGKLVAGLPTYVSATPLGIMLLLEHYKINIESKNVLIVGRSQILGKPLASLMLNQNATVTIAHSKTKNLNLLLKQADVVCICVGKPHFVKAKQLKKGVIIIDPGYNKGVIGDVDLKGADKIASYYTPVPGGVGPMTIASLIMQTVEASEKLV